MAKDSFFKKHKTKIVTLAVVLVVLLIVTYIGLKVYSMVTSAQALASSIGDAAEDLANEISNSVTIESASDDVSDSTEVEVKRGQQTVDGMGGLNANDPPEGDGDINDVSDVMATPEVIPKILTNLGNNYANINPLLRKYVENKHICVQGKSYRVDKVQSNATHDTIIVTPFWKHTGGQKEFQPGDCPGNPWVAEVVQKATVEEGTVTGSAFHPYHQEHGYEGNFFGIRANDFSKVKPGGKVCIHGHTYTLAGGSQKSPGTAYAYIDRSLGSDNNKFMVNDVAKLTTC